jgi:hypothetical protein
MREGVVPDEVFQRHGVAEELLQAAQPFVPMDEADGDYLREFSELSLKAAGDLLVGLRSEEDAQPFQFRPLPDEPALRPFDEQRKAPHKLTTKATSDRRQVATP